MAIAFESAAAAAFNTGPTSKTVTLSWDIDDVVVLSCATASDEVLSPTNVTGLSFTAATGNQNLAGNDSNCFIFWAKATAAGSSVAITMNRTGQTDNWSLVGFVYSGVDTIGNSTGGTAESALTMSVSAGSAVVICIGDWNATDVSTKTMTTSSGTASERYSGRSTGQYGYMHGDWIGVNSGSQSWGITSYSGLIATQTILELTAASSGSSVNGVGTGSFGFSGVANGTAGSEGTGAGSFGFTGVANGTAGTEGQAVGNFGFSGTASGAPGKTGTAVGSFGFTGTASGTNTKEGQAVGSFGFVGTASGVAGSEGLAVGSFGFSGTAVGEAGVVGVGAGSFGFTGTAAGTVGTSAWENFTHDFPGSSYDTTFFNAPYGDTPTVSGNKMTFPSATATYSGIQTKDTHTLIGSYVVVQLDPRSTGGYSGITIKANGSNFDILQISYRHTAGQLQAVYNGSDFSDTDSSTNVAFSGAGVWLRAREDSGTVYLDYSTDGNSWTNLHSDTASASALTALATCRVELNCGPFSSSMTTGPSFANFNILPGVSGVATGSFGFTGTANGEAGVVGTAAGSFGFAGTANGESGAVGVAVGLFGFVGVASGTSDTTGVATGSFGFQGVALGQVGVEGQAVGSFGFVGTASGSNGGITGVATGSFGFTGTASGGPYSGANIPLVPYGTNDVGTFAGTTFTTRTSLGTATSTGTYTIIDPTGINAPETLDVDIWEDIEFTTNRVIAYSATGNPRLFKNCRFNVTAESAMVELDEEGAGGTSSYMNPRTIFWHCTFDGESTSSKALSGGNGWMEYCDVKNCEDGWGGPFCSVMIHSNIVGDTDGLTDPHADGMQFLSIGRAVIWNCFVSAGSVPGAASQALRVGVEFGANTDITVAWSGLDGDAGGWTYQVVGGTNTDMKVYDTVILPGGFGSVDFEPGSTLAIWERVYSDTYGGTYIPAPVAWPGVGVGSFGFTGTASGQVGAGTAQRFKVWNGSSWVAGTLKVWDGSAWVAGAPKVWNGTAWT